MPDRRLLELPSSLQGLSQLPVLVHTVDTGSLNGGVLARDAILKALSAYSSEELGQASAPSAVAALHAARLVGNLDVARITPRKSACDSACCMVKLSLDSLAAVMPVPVEGRNREVDKRGHPDRPISGRRVPRRRLRTVVRETPRRVSDYTAKRSPD